MKYNCNLPCVNKFIFSFALGAGGNSTAEPTLEATLRHDNI